MELTLHIEEEGSGRSEERTVSVAAGDTVRDALRAADINPQTVLVERDGQVVPAADDIREEDETLRVLDVISGG